MFFHHFEKMVPQQYTTSHKVTYISIYIAEMKSTINLYQKRSIFKFRERYININIFDILKGVGHLKSFSFCSKNVFNI